VEERTLTPFGESLKEAAENRGLDFWAFLERVEEGASEEEKVLNARALSGDNS